MSDLPLDLAAQNDQTAAHIRDDLAWFVEAMRVDLAEVSRMDALTQTACLLISEEKVMPRPRLAQLLAMATVLLAESDLLPRHKSDCAVASKPHPCTCGAVDGIQDDV